LLAVAQQLARVARDDEGSSPAGAATYSGA